MLHKTINVHNGNKFLKLVVWTENIGYKIGSFIYTWKIFVNKTSESKVHLKKNKKWATK